MSYCTAQLATACFWSGSLLMHREKQQRVAQVLGSMPPTWHAWMKFQVSGHCCQLGNEPVMQHFSLFLSPFPWLLCLSLSSYYSTFQISKSKKLKIKARWIKKIGWWHTKTYKAKKLLEMKNLTHKNQTIQKPQAWLLQNLYMCVHTCTYKHLCIYVCTHHIHIH